MLRKRDVMRRDQTRAEHADLFHQLDGAQLVILQAEADLVPMLTEMGVNAGMPGVGVLRNCFHKCGRAGHDLPHPVIDLNPSISCALIGFIERVVAIQRFFFCFQHLRRDFSATVHHRAGDGSSHTGFNGGLNRALHKTATGFGKSCDAGLDRLNTVQKRAVINVVGMERTFKRNQKTRPDHGILVRQSSAKKLLAGMRMAVYHAGHGELTGTVQHLCSHGIRNNFGCNTGNSAILDCKILTLGDVAIGI